MSLLEAFPAPPSHIPSAHNPPPSRPPSFPLPPIPGPSSISLPDGRPDSAASSNTTGVGRRSWSIVPRSQRPESLTRLAISPNPYDLIPFPPPARHQHNDSISHIDMRDLPPADDDDDDDDDDVPQSSIPPFNAFRPLHHESLADPIDPRNIPFNNLPPSPPHYVGPPSAASLSPSPSLQESHFEIRAPRSKSSPHTKALPAPSRSNSTPRSPPLPTDYTPLSPASELVPTHKNFIPSSAFQQPEAERSASPDIDSIISSTPRPLRRQPSSFSDLAGANARIVSRNSSLASAISARSRKSSTLSATSPSGASESIAFATTMTLDDISNVVVRETEFNGVESDGENDSDSSLDLHTPLPHLMVKHGLLSPHSKLLPLSEDGENRPESIMSMATKSGIMKDERNTPMRKERHRNGKMLKGGLGLTTGLGWSDSEDEDAPSPFTRRLSHLTLSRQSSATSIRSTSSYFARHLTSAKHPLSKSYSGHGGGGSFDEDEESGGVVDEWGQTRPRTKSTARVGMPPPTSWHGRTGAGSRLSRSSTAASDASFSSVRIKTTTSSPSPDSENPAILSTRSHNGSDDMIQTPSSASSSLSMKFPLTPQDEVLLNGQVMMMSRKGGKMLYDKDKHLPPLPIQPILKKHSSRIGNVGGEGVGYVPFPKTPTRSRAGSINSTHTTSTPTTPKPTAMMKPRPLHLPQRIAGIGDRPAVPVPVLHQTASSTSLRSRQGVKVLTCSKSVPKLSAPSMSRVSSVSGSSSVGSASSSPVSTSTGLLRPKPRTGTGMTYRKSSSSLIGGGTVGGSQEEQQRVGDGRKTPLVSGGNPPALNGLGVRARPKTPGIPRATTTVVGQAF